MFTIPPLNIKRINLNPFQRKGPITNSSIAHFYEGVFIANYSKKDNKKLIEIIHKGIDGIISSGYSLPESIIIDKK